MKKSILREEEKYTVTRRWKKRWYRVTACLAAAVVFCTTYAMILPAVTATTFPPLTDDSAYVDSISVTQIVDGTEAWDVNDIPGNDSGPKNKIVRTFDTVTYHFSVSMLPHNRSEQYGEARVKLEFVLPLTKEEAVFDQSAMGWMDQTSGYTPSLTTENRTINNEPISCQVLTCYKHLLPSGTNNSVIRGVFSNTVTINIKSMKNGATIAPEFSACMEYGEWDGTCSTHSKEEKQTVTADTVKVSAAPKYNIQIGGSHSYKNTFDFNSGNDNAPNREAGSVVGRIFKLGVTLQIYSDDRAKHFKGIELPDGSAITFKLKLTSKYNGNKQPDVDVTDTYTPLLWSFDANSWTAYGATNADGRVLYDQSGSVYEYAPWTGHDNSEYYDDATCLDGGNWSVVQNGDTVTVTVENYKVDADKMPTKNGNGAEVKYGEDLGIGCFSSGEFWIVQPFNVKNSTNTTDNYDIIQAYGEGSFTTSVNAINMTAKSLGGTDFKDEPGTNRTQINQSDDQWSFSLPLVLEGGLQNRIAYRSYKYNPHSDNPGVGTWDSNDGKDFAYPGTELYIHSGFNYSSNNENGKTMLLGTNLVRFDPTVFELNGEPNIIIEGISNPGDITCDIYYVTRDNGENWSSESSLQQSTVENNNEWLKYYDSQKDIPKGWLCIGVLYCFKGSAQQNTLDAYFAADLPVKIRTDNTNDTIGESYITVSTSRVWTEEMFAKSGITLESLPIWSKLTPSKENPLDRYPPNYYKNANYKGAPPAQWYIREKYYDDGRDSTPHNSNWSMLGDTLLVIGFETKITKSLMQTTSAGTKTAFDLDSNQRVVDFKLQPSTSYSNGNQSNIQNTTTVYVVDTLPKYMTYITGSAFMGGKYTQTSPNGGTQGTVTDGTKTDPVVTNNADGTQTLKWTLENITVVEAMDAIYYSAEIGNRYDGQNDIPIGTNSLLNTVKIYAKEDLRTPSTANDKYAYASVTAVRGFAYSFGKYTEQDLTESNGSINYTVYYDNNSGSTITDMKLLDAMPVNGVQGSQFNGTYTVASWKLDVKKCNYTTLRLYYTTDSKYAGIISVTDEVIAAWDQADISPDGTATAMNINQPVAWIITGTLNAGESINVNMQISLNPAPSLESDTNNIFVNTLSNYTDGKFITTQTTNQTVKRTIEGLTWLDLNADGVQNEDSERMLSGVTVSLWKLKEGLDPTVEENYEPYCYQGTDTQITVKTGKQISVLSADSTDASDYVEGRYRFTDLPSGSFAVKFTDGTTQISHLIASPANLGEDDTLDSDGVAIYKADRSALIRTYILNINMPTVNKIQNPIFHSNYNDSGFYNRGYELPKSGGSGTALFTTTGAALFTAAAILLICNRRSYSKRNRQL